MTTNAPHLAAVWETVKIPQRTIAPDETLFAFNRLGQTLTMGVASYEREGGRDFNDNPCPIVRGRVVLSSTTVSSNGVEKVLAFGAKVSLNASQTELAKMIRRIQPAKGNCLQITYIGDVDSRQHVGHTWKAFTVLIDRRQKSDWLVMPADGEAKLVTQMESPAEVANEPQPAAPQSYMPPPPPEHSDDEEFPF